MTDIQKRKIDDVNDAVSFKKLKPASDGTVAALINHESFDRLVSRLRRSRASRQWEKIGIRHHFGVNVPVFSIKTDQSCGVGEFLDLIPLIDWCKSNNFDVIQTLPLNDTNPFDNSPFSPISSFSLNPRLISLRKLPNFDKQTDEMKTWISSLDRLNASARVQWKEVNELKMKWLWAYFCQQGQQELLRSDAFREYLGANRSWLEAYGLFCLLKRVYSWKHWSEWPESKEFEDHKFKESVMEMPFAMRLMESQPDPADSSSSSVLGKDNRKEVDFYMFLQYLCSRQMLEAREYAESHGVFLKGDIPFLVSGDSVDVWINRDFFILERTAGAPPDMYSADGQNWGVPIYNWDAIRKDDFTWWKNRLRTANQYFHLFRIDHVVGFFRVWAIPQGMKGTDGAFEPADEKLWIPQGEEIMKMILDNCDMLPIGEDLGTVPTTVKSCLQSLGICGTRVVRWERAWEKPDQPFVPYEDYNGDSMTTVSTHDSETITQWWLNADSDVAAYSKFSGMKKNKDEPNLTPDQREQILKESHSTPSLFHINLINEYLALDQSLAPMDPNLERVNLPGQVSDANWSYRMMPTIKTVSESEALSSRLKKLNTPIQESQQTVRSL